MPASVLIGLGAFALLSGPICGGIQWHHWNRDRVQDCWGRKARDEGASEKVENGGGP
jgi:hypothetical protein